MHKLERIAVIGTGTMGPGIGAVLARAGFEVSLYDTSKQALDNAIDGVDRAHGILERLDTENRGGSVGAEEDLERAVSDAELVIEAIPERLELKREVFTNVEKLVSPTTVLASNTSGLRITDIATGLQRPEQVIGMHWSNPPHLIPMIEVVPGEETSPSVVDRVVDLVESFGYEPVIEKEIVGFVENRILYAVLREALDLVDEGIIDRESMDTCVRWGIGFKLAVIGPMALIDMAGADIYHAVASYLNRDLSARDDVSPLIGDLIEEGRLGVKSGAGMYEYSDQDIADLARRRAEALVRVRKALSE